MHYRVISNVLSGNIKCYVCLWHACDGFSRQYKIDQTRIITVFNWF